MKVAIIGGGISGLTAAYYLNPQHQISIYESANKIGGHTATVDITHAGQDYAIDTGFIVYNDWTYPNFIKLLDELNVDSQPTEMSFSVRCDDSGIEYGGSNLNTLFAQRSNIFKPAFHRMIRDIVRFNREAIQDLDDGQLPAGMTLGNYLESNCYSESFIYQYVLPMGCAIWSASTERMTEFPIRFFIQFFKNHGLLSIKNRPQWRVIKGGSRNYLSPLTKSFKDSISVNASVKCVRRRGAGIELVMNHGQILKYDQVVIACHSDQALALLDDPTEEERSALSSIPYQQNDVVLHTDESLLPRARRAWSSWNYLLKKRFQERAVLSYDMNILQGISSKTTFCITLNATDLISENKIIEKFHYSHPVFSLESISAAERINQLNGTLNTWFAGAYLGNGFHEDGVKSGLRVAELINILPNLNKQNNKPKAAASAYA